MLKLMIGVIACWIIGVIVILLIWIKDCKEIGKENLAVSLTERLEAFFWCFVFPVIVAVIVSTTRKR